MPTIEDRIKQFEDELHKTIRNKATEHHIGVLLARIAKLKRESEARRARSGGSGKGFAVKKEGDATVFLVGFPSVGKSTLLTALTGKESKAAAYEFTTLDAIPGMLRHKGLNIQLLDIPGLIEGASQGKGRGKEVLSAIRSADLLLILIDAKNPEKQLGAITRELYSAGFRLNDKPANVSIDKTTYGGIEIISRGKIGIERQTLIKILNEFGYHSARLVINEQLTPERLVDAIVGNRIYLNAIYVVNKADLLTEKERKQLKQKIDGVLFISAEGKLGLHELKDKIVQGLSLIKLYTKRPDGTIDKEKPLIMKTSSTIRDVCTAIHRDFIKNFKYAQIWGKSAKFTGQKVGLEHKVADGDIIYIRVQN